jgi:hypothetical protein
MLRVEDTLTLRLNAAVECSKAVGVARHGQEDIGQQKPTTSVCRAAAAASRTKVYTPDLLALPATQIRRVSAVNLESDDQT